MLKVCMVTPSFPRYGADMAGISVGVLAEGLAKKGETVHVMSLCRVLNHKYEDRIHVYQPPKMRQTFGRLVLTSVHSFCGALYLFPRVDIIHYHWTAISPNLVGIMASAPIAQKRPSLLTVRGGDLRAGLQNPIRFSLVKGMLKKVNRVVAISQGMYDIARMYDVPRAKLTIIPNGVDTTLFSPRADGELIRKKFDIGDCPLVVSEGFEKIKGMEHLIQAIPKILNEIPDVKFILIGKKEKRETELRTLARKLDLCGATFFVFSAPYHMMPRFFAAADVVAAAFCVTADNILSTEFGRVHLEALACGTPVITSLAKGLIENERTGFRVDTKTNDIASAIVRTLQDQKLRKNMGRNARKLILKHYSAETMTERYLELYKELAAH